MLKQKRADILLTTLKECFPVVKPSLNYATPWEFLVAVMLSAQCTDARVNMVTESLFRKYKTVRDYAEADISELEQDIHSTGFFRSKAKHIKATAQILHYTFQDSVPETMDEMLKLPGVARKTANVVLGVIYGKAYGIAVDTHVRRLSLLYGLTESHDPVKIEKELMKLLPKREWTEFTMRMIEYGRTYCPAKKHDHAQCPIVCALKEKQLLPEVRRQ
ncbi:endonuclease III [Candidatus Woesebacteria bacterium]|nr:endonuclease III [Candidatus Woesebacteria bacterium]